MKFHRDHGATLVARTAGSHGAFDVFALYEDTRTVVLEQCKASREKVIVPFAADTFYVRFEVVRPQSRRRRKK